MISFIAILPMNIPFIQNAPIIQEIVPEDIEKTTEVSIEALIESRSREYNLDVELVKRIINCESGMNPEAIGRLAIVGVDIGLWQINSFFHEETAREMGLNIYEATDNLEYGLILLKEEGTRPWRASKHCWYRQAAL